MGRYLPWRDDPADGTKPRKRIKAGPRTDGLGARKNAQEDTIHEDEYMRDGIKNDDRYIMVEDELLQIAKSYTAKLHSAELARLQAQIAFRKTQKLAAPQASQPRITGSIPKQRQVVLQRRAHDSAIRKAAGINEDGEEESYNPKFSSQSLGRLMTTSATRINSTLPLPLTPGKAIRLATRAAAGFTKASFKKASSSQISSSQLRSSQIAKEDYNDNGEKESDESDDEDLDFVPRRSSSTRKPPKMMPIERPISSHASDKRISLSKHPHTSAHHSKLLSSSPQGFKKPSLLSSSPPPLSSRRFNLSSDPKISKQIPASTPKPEPLTVDSDSDNDYANPEQAARWRQRSLQNSLATSSSTINPIPTPSSTFKSKPIIVDSDDDDYADAEQAARFRKRKLLAEAQKYSTKS